MSALYKEDNLCGDVDYAIKDFSGNEAPSFIEVSYEKGSPKFTIKLNTASWATATYQSLLLEVSLVNYPDFIPEQ